MSAEHFRSTPREHAEKRRGARLPEYFFYKEELDTLDPDHFGRGLVMDDRAVPAEIWGKINAYAIPLVPGPWPGGFDRKARQIMEQYTKKMGKGTLFAVPDEESDGGFTVAYVPFEMLDRDPRVLLIESIEAIRQRDYELSETKRVAAMMIMGVSDLK